tara:strand:+ start:7333 stop:7737 length:405 start_codon:yes stop_codon:yes gene_type:complete
MSHREGGCLCGAVRYTLTGDPRAVTLCHCSHCQRVSGSVFSFNLVVREADYQQIGETAVFTDFGDSGQPVQRHFCSRCGSSILAKIAAAPGKVVLKGGSLDNKEGLRPFTEIYTAQALSWLAPVEGTTRLAGSQ